MANNLLELIKKREKERESRERGREKGWGYQSRPLYLPYMGHLSVRKKRRKRNKGTNSAGQVYFRTNLRGH